MLAYEKLTLNIGVKSSFIPIFYEIILSCCNLLILVCECNRDIGVHQDFILVNYLVTLDFYIYFSLGTDLILSEECLTLIIKHDLKVLS